MAFDKRYVLIGVYTYYTHDLCREKRYVAIKALKGYSTHLESKQGLTWELPALQHIASSPPLPSFESTHCPQLLDHFTHPGFDQDGN
jgi:hypothetical protein